MPAQRIKPGACREREPAKARGRMSFRCGRRCVDQRVGHPATDLPVVPFCRRHFACDDGQIISRSLAILCPQNEGRFAIVTDVGRGMRWTLCALRRTALTRTAKSCGPSAADFEVPTEFAATPLGTSKS